MDTRFPNHLKTLLLVALTAATAGCINFSSSPTVHGSGNIIQETREITGIDRISVSGTGELALVQGEEESLTIEADDNLLPLIQSEVHNGHLSLGPRNANLRPTHTITYCLHLKKVRALDVSGAVRVDAGNIESDRLELNISGSGKISVGRLETRVLSARISGAGTTSTRGFAERQDIHISGSGSHNAPELKSTRAEIHLSGAARASVWVTDHLSAQASGAGSVEYRGTPSVDWHVSGAGHIRHRDAGE